MSDHNELVTEIPVVEKMSTHERLKHAKKRRHQQLKKFNHYERQLDKEQHKKNKKSQGSKRPPNKKARTSKVMFDSNIMLLEAATRNDVDEGEFIFIMLVSASLGCKYQLHGCLCLFQEFIHRMVLCFRYKQLRAVQENPEPVHDRLIPVLN